MLSFHITLSLAIQMLTKVVEDRGYNHRAGDGLGVGTSCIYGTYVNGVMQPVCIVGQMFHNIGLLGLLVNPADASQQADSCGSMSALWDRLSEHGVIVDRDAREFLASAQRSQDNGDIWGMALAKALRNAKEARTAEILGKDDALHNIAATENRLIVLADPSGGELADWERELLNPQF